MNKRWLFLILPIPIFLILFIVARITGVIQFYRCPTPSSEPTIKIGQFFFTTNLKEPSRGDFITFKSNPYHDSIAMMGTHGQNYVHRLVAMEGDMIEMKDGVLFVNNQNFDAGKNLTNRYTAAAELATQISGFKEKELKGELIKVGEDLYDIFLTTAEANEMNKKGLKLEKILLTNPATNYGAFAWIKKDSSWSIDRFGPLKIPGDCFFVLGDNRHNALDSRYIGFVKKKNYTGTVLGIR